MGGLVASFACLLIVTAPGAQPATRRALLDLQRAAKAADLRPLQPHNLERILFRIEDEYLMQRVLNAPRGAFVWFGGLPTGSGLAAGPAYRHTGQVATTTVWGTVSTHRYRELGGTLAFPRLASGRAFAEVGARRREFTQDDFFGLGPASDPDAEANYALRETVLSATAGVTPTWWLRASGTIEHRSPRPGRGRDPDEPSVEALFPGLPGFNPVEPVDYVRVGTRAAINATGRPFGSPLGGLYTIGYDRYADIGPGVFSFNRWEADLRQYIPVAGLTRTLALRAHYVSLLPDAGHDVPFYLQPTLGGPDSLRGLAAYRLRDRNTLLLQSEYRWDVNAFVGGVLFYEAGSVARRPGDFRIRDFTQDFGAGVRFGFLTAVSLRIEAVFGAGEGTVFMFRFGSVF